MLQEQFNYFIFKKEQELYKKENIIWDIINYPDNKQIINLFLPQQINEDIYSRSTLNTIPT